VHGANATRNAAIAQSFASDGKNTPRDYGHMKRALRTRHARELKSPFIIGAPAFRRLPSRFG
jgi:hypothetical protein